MLFLKDLVHQNRGVDAELLESKHCRENVLLIEGVQGGLDCRRSHYRLVDPLLHIAQRNPNHQIGLKGKLVPFEHAVSLLCGQNLENLSLGSPDGKWLVGVLQLNTLCQCSFFDFLSR